MRKSVLACLFAAVVAGCATTPTPDPIEFQVPGNSIAVRSPVLYADTFFQIAMLSQIENPACNAFKLEEANVVEPVSNGRYRNDGVLLEGSWAEVWKIDGCGKEISKRIKFTADGSGGTFFELSV